MFSAHQRIQEEHLSKTSLVMLNECSRCKLYRSTPNSLLPCRHPDVECSNNGRFLWSLTCYRVGPRHHEGRGWLWRVWKRAFGGVTLRLRFPCGCVGLLLLVCPGRVVGRCCCCGGAAAARVFFGNRRAGVGPHTLSQAMAPAGSQAAILTPLQAGATAVIVLRGAGDGGWGGD